MKRFSLALTAVLLAMVMFAAPASAASHTGNDSWQFQLAPFYLWAASIEGDVGVGPVDQSLDASFGDIVGLPRTPRRG